MIEMEPKGTITPEVFDMMKAMLPPSSARARFNHDKKTHIDESVKFWEDALEYVRSDEYTPETYNLRFCDGGWCGHAPFVNKLQPDTGDKMFKYTPRKQLASNIKAFIEALESMRK